MKATLEVPTYFVTVSSCLAHVLEQRFQQFGIRCSRPIICLD